MDEEIVGLSRVTTGHTYQTCTRCGVSFQPRRATGRKTRRSAAEECLCGRCYRETLKGELPALDSSEDY
ncbi:MAG TPA: hypothetical protein VHR86_04090 [Armatimonadota bacterium]|nr:hypothetical protein [Armatimonadota bacterium]